MENISYLVLALVIAGTAISKTVDAIKPIYEKLSFANSISILLAMGLGVALALGFSPLLESHLEIEIPTVGIIFGGLLLGTGASTRYDLWKIVQGWGSTKVE